MQARWVLAVLLVVGTSLLGWLLMWVAVLSSIPFFRSAAARGGPCAAERDSTVLPSEPAQQRISHWSRGTDPARMHLCAAILSTALRSRGHKGSRPTGRTSRRRRRGRRRRRLRKMSPTPLLPPPPLLLFPKRELRDQPLVSIPSKRATILFLRMPFQPPNRRRRWNLTPALTRMCRSVRRLCHLAAWAL